jgi:glucosamine--fructose-6-phosphate aminotransferase (isomerizing)
MCGIIGYLGNKKLTQVLLTGLKRLEYRGYDSAGVCAVDGGALSLSRSAGRISALEKQLEETPVEGSVGIAHTRWATHGAPTERNAHPHVDASGKFGLVHNGIIENHSAVRAYLEAKGVEFQSETDSEALVQLIGHLYAESGDMVASVRRALADVTGAYGIALVCTDAPDTLIAARRGSPLIVGVGEGEYLVSSDGSAIVEHTSQVIYLHDNEMVCLGPKGIEVSTIDAQPVHREIDVLEMTLDQIQLGGYEHFMRKEIHEQPESLRNCMRGRLDRRSGAPKLGGLEGLDRELARCERIVLTACGTAWHAGLIGEYLFEELARVPTEVEYASELRYRNPVIERGTIGIVISQSGETADTLAALREMRLKGATVLGVVNAVGSTIARETDAGIYLHAGAEIGVASTKAFTAQVAVLAMMAVDTGRRRHLAPERTAQFLEELDQLPDKVEIALGLDQQAQELARRLYRYENWLYLGRGVNYPVALEGALKLKEISYIHAEGLPAAEMKHGPIALIDENMPVVVIAPRDHTYEKVLANIEEVCARQGRVIAIASEEDAELERLAEEVMYVPATLPLLSPIITTVPLQLIAYHAALERGHDVDKPRNLAKSVTVE